MGRVVITGLYSDGSSHIALQASVNSQTAVGQPLWETRDNAAANGVGYTNTTVPTIIAYYHSVNYYDDYDFPGNNFGQPIAPQAPKERTKGLLTGTSITTLGTGTMLLTVNYYDFEGRVVQSKSNNHLNGTDVVSNIYNFAGELTASTRAHTVNGTTTVIANRYEYDHVGRKIATFENINNQGEVALNHLEYNEIGQLNKKNLHNDAQATTFAYNERGWLKNSTSDQFNMVLKYNDGTLPQFNGNISGQDYTNGASNAFSYTYDRLNRLTNATAGNSLGEAIGYDVMGNISSLTRDGFGTNNYTGYNGNKLTAISGFTNSSYAYDANGNLKSDSQKNITLGYNFLNLPQTVSGSQNLNYTYNAAGEKLKKQNGSNIIDYVDGIQYTNGSIDFIQTEEGIARNSSGSYSYEYNLSDHLGNVRTTFYKNPNTGQLEVLQRDDYYAFGLRKVATGGTNKYLYNGKELQEELGAYDYGARFYDPVIARWNVIDPLAEKFVSLNPYNYGVNNPIRFIDPDGMESSSIHLDKYGTILKNIDDGDDGVYVHKNAKNQADVDKKYSSDNTSAGGKKIGELGGTIDVNDIMSNILKRDGNIASGMTKDQWVWAVLPTHEWDLKNNKNTVFGVAWDFDRGQNTINGTDNHTSFKFKGLGENGTFNAADVGNYHAGYTGVAVGMSQRAQYTWAGLGEIAKGSNIGTRLREIIFNVSPNGDQRRDFHFNTQGMVDGVKAGLHPRPRPNPVLNIREFPGL